MSDLERILRERSDHDKILVHALVYIFNDRCCLEGGQYGANVTQALRDISPSVGGASPELDIVGMSRHRPEG